MHTAVIYAHPWRGSFNRAILDGVMKRLEASGREHALIDLYNEGFNPVMTEKDLSLYNAGKSADPTVDRYNRILDQSDEVILIFPIWWYDMPAILRGFFDKVMLIGSAYTEGEDGLCPLRDMNRVVLFTTSYASTRELVERFGDPVNGTIIGATFKVIGFNHAEWHNLGAINQTTEEQRLAYLDNIGRILSGMPE